MATCSAVLSELGMDFTISAMYSDDDSGCTYHPGQTGWAQVMHSGLDSGATPAPTCDEVNADPSRRRVCACKEVAAETPEPVAPTLATATLVRTLGQPRANYNPSLAEIPDLKGSGVNVERETFKSVEVTFTLTQQGGVAEAEARKDDMTSERMRTLIADKMQLGAAQSLDVSLDLVTPPRPPPTPPPMPPSSPPPLAPPLPPSPPPSTETVVVRLTAFGTVEDYTPDVTRCWRRTWPPLRASTRRSCPSPSLLAACSSPPPSRCPQRCRATACATSSRPSSATPRPPPQRWASP